ncbi:MAG: AAA family ATPase [Bacilli bacterium]|nr:AAA family ATPase [Bacilli bacterium]
MIKYEAIEKFFYDNYYVSNEKLNYYTLLGINLIGSSTLRDGQDIYTVCLDGPPGAGKSMYAKLYAEMVHQLLNEEVELISYQCDDATSKIELFEDINVGAAVAGKSEEVNIPGVLARAIIAANEGKKVILFIDEYDKTREQVDSLFLQFLQDGRINTNQFGDLAIKPEYKGNIHVLFCKNDARTELTGPLTRRIRKIELSIIKPEDFMNLAIRKFVTEENKDVTMPIVELIALIYECVYSSSDYTRLPATSEMFQTIADILFLNEVNSPGYIVYDFIVEGLFKEKDDRHLFNESLETLADETVKNILLSLKKETDKSSSTNKIKDMIIAAFQGEANRQLDPLRQELVKKQQDLETEKKTLEDSYKQKIQEVDAKLADIERFAIEKKKEFNSIILKKKNNVEETRTFMGDLYAKNFTYATPLIRRGENVFLEGEEWHEYATLTIDLNEFDNEILMAQLLDAEVAVYENGYLKSLTISTETNEKIYLVIVREKDTNGELKFHVFTNKNLNSENMAEKVREEVDGVISEIFYLIIKLNNNDEYDYIATYNGGVSYNAQKRQNTKTISYIKGTYA